MACGASAGKSLFSLSFTNLALRRRRPLPPLTHLLGFNPNRTFCLAAAPSTTAETDTPSPETLSQSLLLERLRLRHLKNQSKPPPKPSKAPKSNSLTSTLGIDVGRNVRRSGKASSFEELGLGNEVMGAVREMGISEPTEIQSIGVPAVLAGESVVLGSHTGSGKTLAYLLPIVQLMRQDEELTGMITKPKRPRAVVLCPTRELCEQVFRVTKSISHHARFRSTMISGGGRLRPQEDSLCEPIDMVVGTPGRVLKHIEDGNLVYGEIKYLVLDEADTMFDHGFGPDLRKFLSPLKNRAAKSGDQGFQTVLVTATMTKAVQKLIDEEFQGIVHLRTSSFQKKVASARHDFIKLSGSENKLEALLQVLEPSLSKGNRVMVFCNTLNSSRAVDHFLHENQIFTVNYHGEVPAEERVENLKKFKSEEGDCPTLVCTDLAARGLDLEVDHVIMFDFPMNSIDYLHRTGRTARMGAKGKVTSLVAKKDIPLATKIEEAIKKNESLESLSVNGIRREAATQKAKGNVILTKKFHKPGGKTASAHKTPATKIVKKGPTAKAAAAKKVAGTKVKKSVTLSKPIRPGVKGAKKVSTKVNKLKQGTKYDTTRVPSSKQSTKYDTARVPSSKLSVVGFRGRSSVGRKQSAKMN